MNSSTILDLLETNYHKYHRTEFIENDPIAIPHRYSLAQDIEIAGLFSATLAWGNRKVILKKCSELISLLDNSPFDFIKNHSERDLNSLRHFKHRTFNTIDLLYFIHFLNKYYSEYSSLEDIFRPAQGEKNIKTGLIRFHEYFTSDDYFPTRTGKHVSNPLHNSACKRLNMYLRWMVRRDESKVDFGLWRKIHPRQLICPVDLHVERVARALRLIVVNNSGWKMAEELTDNLKQFDKEDPVKYDFALFGMGLERIY